MKADWKVLLIGGSGATGKSHLARQLAKHLEIPLTEVDDIRIALQKIADPKIHPNLFFFLNNPNYLQEFEVDELVKKLLDVGQEIWPALNELISKHIVCNEPVIFEGDGIIPELLNIRNVANKMASVRTIFIYDDEGSIYQREINRPRRGNQELDLELAKKQAKFSYVFGQEIKRQAEQHGFISIKSSPIETLLNRVIEVLESRDE